MPTVLHGQTVPAPQPVQGTIKAVAGDGRSFVVTGKKSDVTVAATADTRFTLDDAPSTAKALVVGRDVNAILTGDGASAYVVLVSNVPVKGTVKSVATDGKSVVVTVAPGQDVTITLAPAAVVTFDKNPAALAALAAGSTVKVTTNAEGEATGVAGKTAKASKVAPDAPAANTPGAKP